MTADLDMGGPERVINLIDPVIARDAATEKKCGHLEGRTNDYNMG